MLFVFQVCFFGYSWLIRCFWEFGCECEFNHRDVFFHILDVDQWNSYVYTCWCTETVCRLIKTRRRGLQVLTKDPFGTSRTVGTFSSRVLKIFQWPPRLFHSLASATTTELLLSVLLWGSSGAYYPLGSLLSTEWRLKMSWISFLIEHSGCAGNGFLSRR